MHTSLASRHNGGTNNDINSHQHRKHSVFCLMSLLNQKAKIINLLAKVNVSVYSLKFLLRSADFTFYAPGIGTLSYTVSSPLGRIQHLRTFLHL